MDTKHDDAHIEAVMARINAGTEAFNASIEHLGQTLSARERIYEAEAKKPPPCNRFADFEWEIRSITDDDADQRIITGIATTPTRDRVGDIIDPRGAVYADEIPLLLDHNAADVIGVVRLGPATADGISFVARIAKIATPGALKDLTDKAWQAIKAGLRKFVSIGFRPIDRPVRDGDGLRFDGIEILELSLCVIAANPDARIITAKAAEVPRQLDPPAVAPRSEKPKLLLEQPITSYLPQVMAEEMLAESQKLAHKHWDEALDFGEKIANEDTTKPMDERYATCMGMFAASYAHSEGIVSARLAFHAAMYLAKLYVDQQVAPLRERVYEVQKHKPVVSAGAIGFDDLDVESKDGGRIIAVTMRSGEREITKEVKLDVPIYRGAYEPGTTASAGDCVTHAGSLWIALEDTQESPGNGSKAWRLAVKRGRDAKGNNRDD